MLLYQQGDGVLAASAPELLEQIRVLGERIDVNYTLESLDRSDEPLERGLEADSPDRRRPARFRPPRRERRERGGPQRRDRDDVNIISGRAHDQGVELVLDLSPLPRFAGSPGKLNQVVLNLLANAIDASAGGGTVKIRTRTDPAGQGVAIDIIDNGRGSTRRSATGSLTPSSPPNRSGRGPGWVCRSATASSATTAARSAWNRPLAREPTSPFSCLSAAPLPPSQKRTSRGDYRVKLTMFIFIIDSCLVQTSAECLD